MRNKYIVRIFFGILLIVPILLLCRFLLIRYNPSVNYELKKTLDNSGENNTERVINILNTYPSDFFETEVCELYACKMAITDAYPMDFTKPAELTEFNYFNFWSLSLKIKDDDIRISFYNRGKSDKVIKVEEIDYKNEDEEIDLIYDEESVYISIYGASKGIEIKQPNITREILLEEEILQEHPEYIDLVLKEDKKVQDKLEEIIKLSEGYEKPDKYYEKSKKVSDKIEYVGDPDGDSVNDYINWLEENGYK